MQTDLADVDRSLDFVEHVFAGDHCIDVPPGDEIEGFASRQAKVQPFQQRLDWFTVRVRIADEIVDGARAAARRLDRTGQPRLRATEAAERGDRAILALEPTQALLQRQPTILRDREPEGGIGGIELPVEAAAPDPERIHDRFGRGIRMERRKRLRKGQRVVRPGHLVQSRAECLTLPQIPGVDRSGPLQLPQLDGNHCWAQYHCRFPHTNGTLLHIL